MGTRQLGQLLNRAVELFRDEGPGALPDATAAFLAHSTGRRVRALERSARARYHRTRYGDAAPRPYELISVDPSDVQHLIYPNFHNHYRHVDVGNAYVKGGDWDRNYRDETVFTREADQLRVTELDNWVFYRSLVEHFENGVEWPDTEWYRRVAAEDGIHDQVEYESVERMDERLARTDALYDCIRDCGYRTQAELLEDGVPFEVTRDPRPEHHEVVVNVGRDGTLFFEEGRHRLTIAKALDLDAIPVRVLVRHSEWQALRHRVATASDPSDLSETVRNRLDHPDLRAVAPPELSPSRRQPDAPSELRP